MINTSWYNRRHRKTKFVSHSAAELLSCPTIFLYTWIQHSHFWVALSRTFCAKTMRLRGENCGVLQPRASNGTRNPRFWQPLKVYRKIKGLDRAVLYYPTWYLGCNPDSIGIWTHSVKRLLIWYSQTRLHHSQRSHTKTTYLWLFTKALGPSTW